jgi:hypothetical protein
MPQTLAEGEKMAVTRCPFHEPPLRAEKFPGIILSLHFWTQNAIRKLPAKLFMIVYDKIMDPKSLDLRVP